MTLYSTAVQSGDDQLIGTQNHIRSHIRFCIQNGDKQLIEK